MNSLSLLHLIISISMFTRFPEYKFHSNFNFPHYSLLHFILEIENPLRLAYWCVLSISSKEKAPSLRTLCKMRLPFYCQIAHSGLFPSTSGTRLTDGVQGNCFQFSRWFSCRIEMRQILQIFNRDRPINSTNGIK